MIVDFVKKKCRLVNPLSLMNTQHHTDLLCCVTHIPTEQKEVCLPSNSLFLLFFPAVPSPDRPTARDLLCGVQPQPADLPAVGAEECRRDGAAEVVHRPVGVPAQPPAGPALPLRVLLRVQGRREWMAMQ